MATMSFSCPVGVSNHAYEPTLSPSSASASQSSFTTVSCSTVTEAGTFSRGGDFFPLTEIYADSEVTLPASFDTTQ